MSDIYAIAFDNYGSNQRLFFTFAISLAHTVPVALHSLFLAGIEAANLFQDRVTQRGKNVDEALLKSSWIQFFLNHFVVMPFFIWLVYPWLNSYINISVDTIPPFGIICRDIFICVLFEDALFYWTHRALHHPLLYKRFHKKHHEFKVLKGMSIASEYTHPIESLAGNIVAVIAGPIFTRCHMVTFLLWLVIRMLKTSDAHSGYDFKWSPFGIFLPLNPARRHDFHHETGLGSYGSFFVFWDFICGTDLDYIEHASKRIASRNRETRNKAK